MGFLNKKYRKLERVEKLLESALVVVGRKKDKANPETGELVYVDEIKEVTGITILRRRMEGY